ncbi:hypothetical protein DFH11DRAFT_1630853 [Phellopilus nigrolimitatus]|nr:hypothetical protein DFH11DRAFT_1630853 [Phellopilus nigrolimitatus]
MASTSDCDSTIASSKSMSVLANYVPEKSRPRRKIANTDAVFFNPGLLPPGVIFDALNTFCLLLEKHIVNLQLDNLSFLVLILSVIGKLLPHLFAEQPSEYKSKVDAHWNTIIAGLKTSSVALTTLPKNCASIRKYIGKLTMVLGTLQSCSLDIAANTREMLGNDDILETLSILWSHEGYASKYSRCSATNLVLKLLGDTLCNTPERYYVFLEYVTKHNEGYSDNVAKLVLGRVKSEYKVPTEHQIKLAIYTNAAALFGLGTQHAVGSSVLSEKGVLTIAKAFSKLSSTSEGLVKPTEDCSLYTRFASMDRDYAINRCISFFGVIARSPDGDHQISRMLRHNLLEAIVDLSAEIDSFPMACDLHDQLSLLLASLSRLLIYPSVIEATAEALARLSCEVLQEKIMHSKLRDSWLRFESLAAERLVFKRVFDLVGRVSVCNNCQKEMNLSYLKRCAGCSFATYCSRECHVDAWKSNGHREECAQKADLDKGHRMDGRVLRFIVFLAKCNIYRHLPGLRSVLGMLCPGKSIDKLGVYVNLSIVPPVISMFDWRRLVLTERSWLDNQHTINQQLERHCGEAMLVHIDYFNSLRPHIFSQRSSVYEWFQTTASCESVPKSFRIPARGVDARPLETAQDNIDRVLDHMGALTGPANSPWMAGPFTKNLIARLDAAVLAVCGLPGDGDGDGINVCKETYMLSSKKGTKIEDAKDDVVENVFLLRDTSNHLNTLVGRQYPNPADSDLDLNAEGDDTLIVTPSNSSDVQAKPKEIGSDTGNGSPTALSVTSMPDGPRVFYDALPSPRALHRREKVMDESVEAAQEGIQDFTAASSRPRESETPQDGPQITIDTHEPVEVPRIDIGFVAAGCVPLPSCAINLDEHKETDHAPAKNTRIDGDPVLATGSTKSVVHLVVHFLSCNSYPVSAVIRALKNGACVKEQEVHVHLSYSSPFFGNFQIQYRRANA